MIWIVYGIIHLSRIDICRCENEVYAEMIRDALSKHCLGAEWKIEIRPSKDVRGGNVK